MRWGTQTQKDKEVVKVAAVTGLRSDQNQLQDLLQRIVLAVEWPTPTPESSLLRLIIFRLTAPNWERPSPYDGSHIIMSISGI